MALINCPECSREISDKVKSCPNCGYPFQEESSPIVQDSTIPSPSIIQQKRSKKIIVIPILITIILAIGSFLFYYFYSIVPQNKYSEVISLLESGEYGKGKALLDKLGDYKDAKTIQNQIKYESISYTCINILKQILKNPDSYLPYEIKFYSFDDNLKSSKPVCIMHYGAQNGFGGNTTGDAVFTYADDEKVYKLLGTCNTLNKDDLDSKDDDYAVSVVTIAFIKACQDKGTEVGSINMPRLKVVLKNNAYSTIKVID